MLVVTVGVVPSESDSPVLVAVINPAVHPEMAARLREHFNRLNEKLVKEREAGD